MVRYHLKRPTCYKEEHCGKYQQHTPLLLGKKVVTYVFDPLVKYDTYQRKK